MSYFNANVHVEGTELSIIKGNIFVRLSQLNIKFLFVVDNDEILEHELIGYIISLSVLHISSF